MNIDVCAHFSQTAPVFHGKKLPEKGVIVRYSSVINVLPLYIKSPKSKSNVSKYFNHDFHPYYKIAVSEDKSTYRLSNTGYSRNLLLQK